MKKLIWGLSVLAVAAFFGYLLAPVDSGATTGRTGTTGKYKGLGFNPNNVEEARDAQPDDIRDVSGADRNQDRVPDSDPDRGGPDGDGAGTGNPDCINEPGDNESGSGCGNSAWGDDSTSDRNGPGEGYSDHVPDSDKYSPADWPGDNGNQGGFGSGDARADQEFSDRRIIQGGGVPEAGSEPGDATADRTVWDGIPDAADEGDLTADRPGADATPDGAGPDTSGAGSGTGAFNGIPWPGPGSQNAASDRGASIDATPDGDQDRDGTNRSRGRWNRTAASRDVHGLFGPADHVRDHAADEGGLSTTASFGGGGGGGCSLVAAHAVTPGAGLAYLLILLAPVAFVMARRIRR